MAEAQPERHISANTAARFLRGASSTFMAGAAAGLRDSGATTVTPIEGGTPAEPLLVRQASARFMRQTTAPNQVMERLQHEAMDAFTRNMTWIILTSAICLGLVIAGIVVFCVAFNAVMFHDDKPCDMPLKYYLLVNIAWSQVPGKMQQAIMRDGGENWSGSLRLVVAVAMSIPGWVVIGWGYWMVQNSVTCPKTNPELFYPIQHLVYFNMIFAVFGLVITLVLALGAGRLMLYVASLKEGVGCAKAVSKLPKVAADSQDLISAEDGEVLGCPICMDSLANNGAVKTACDHYFHEECLSTWCAAHLDCPMCRKQIAEPDAADVVTPGEP